MSISPVYGGSAVWICRVNANPDTTQCLDIYFLSTRVGIGRKLTFVQFECELTYIQVVYAFNSIRTIKIQVTDYLLSSILINR